MEIVISLSLVLIVVVQGSSLVSYEETNEGTSSSKDIQLMLAGIYEEHSFDTILLVQPINLADSIADAVHRFISPKVLMTESYGFEFIRKFNAEIMAVLVMEATVDQGLLNTTALTLNFMRQVRILVVAVNVLAADQNQFGEQLLKLCEGYKMTRVVVKFFNSDLEKTSQYLKLKPYPQYQWTLKDKQENEGIFTYKDWKNFQNKTVLTYTSQTSPRAFFFIDSKGKLKLNGYVARLILLFGERFNVTLKMYKPLDMEKLADYSAINKMVDDNMLDIPMLVDAGQDARWLQRSDVVDFISLKLMVPCARPLGKLQTYSLLLNAKFFAYFSICTLMYSVAHSLIDFLFDGLVQWVDFVLSDKAWPGVLGQSFAARKAPRLTLKLIYILLFFTGLNISIQFSANMNTLLTRPPHERRIQSFDDFNKSPLRVLEDMPGTEMAGSLITKPIVSLNNSKLYKDYRQNFNTSYAYFVSSSSWKLFTQKQQFFSQKVFCTHDNLTLYSTMPLAILLQRNSEYKEALNYLIHRSLDLGLIDAWHADTFTDLLKTKEISILDPNPEKGFKHVVVSDLYWIWMIVVVGLTSSLMAFLVELLVAWWSRRSTPT